MIRNPAEAAIRDDRLFAIRERLRLTFATQLRPERDVQRAAATELRSRGLDDQQIAAALGLEVQVVPSLLRPPPRRRG